MPFWKTPDNNQDNDKQMLTIKQATSLHLNVLVELFEQYREFYNAQPDKSRSQQFLEQRLNSKDSIILLAFDGQEAAGFVQVYPVFSSVAMRRVWLLNDLFVTHSKRQKGVAKKLMLAIEAEAQKAKVFSIKLATAIDNENAKHLYQSLGYRLIDNFDHYSKRIV
ncbi:GNAT family N-acetyltransferase [Aliikangiella coralliicola]|uniref:GNAT family N-acetyltransferase n=1 Tax=Aliikangiella coralliicola TaxID=2592383 RepID=A0A545U7E8_9GAMM|nr:GNAT family N-acetyltransferase [Aliikangiella coralliicola]TQV85333.1 GNAT family N-acetyltransferase [Aliikangiella coralliicola]